MWFMRKAYIGNACCLIVMFCIIEYMLKWEMSVLWNDLICISRTRGSGDSLPVEQWGPTILLPVWGGLLPLGRLCCSPRSQSNVCHHPCQVSVGHRFNNTHSLRILTFLLFLFISSFIYSYTLTPRYHNFLFAGFSILFCLLTCLLIFFLSFPSFPPCFLYLASRKTGWLYYKTYPGVFEKLKVTPCQGSIPPKSR